VIFFVSSAVNLFSALVGRLTNKYSLNDFYLLSVPVVVGQATNNGKSERRVFHRVNRASLFTL